MVVDQVSSVIKLDLDVVTALVTGMAQRWCFVMKMVSVLVKIRQPALSVISASHFILILALMVARKFCISHLFFNVLLFYIFIRLESFST